MRAPHRNPTCLSRLVSQLSYLNTAEGLTRAQSVIQRLRSERQLHRLDANSLGLLAVAAAKGGHTLYAASIVKSMLKSGYLPHVKAWSAVVSRLAAAGDDGPAEALKLFNSVTKRVRRFDDSEIVKDSRPDTGAYNAVLNACANLGDAKTFHQLFDEMSEFKCEPDALTYNVMIKLCARVERKDLLVFVLERIIEKGVTMCMTTLHSLVAAYVGFGDLDTAEKLVQAMRDGRRDICKVLRDSCNDDDDDTYSDDEIDKAEDLIREMVSVGIEPDVVSYNTLIDGCITVDDSAGALTYFNEMRKRGIAPTKVSYTTLMKAFASTGQPKLANKVFDEMINDPRVKVDLVAWNMLVDGYCKLGLVEEAKSIIQRMKDNGVYPNVATYGSLVNGIALARKPGEALLLWNEIKERCGVDDNESDVPALKPDEGLLDALADICVRAAFFRKALEIVACMEEHGIAPNKTKYKRIYVEMHSRMFTSKHASRARQDRRRERKRAAEAFKFWLGLPNSYYGSEWRLDPAHEDE
ncbi:pentatricopeptide repeat-containing protein at3g09650 chloroplastic [Phtheirospermum japonicum]|uniref:Pentatricopeptide repeat-containing protein at3g09650 chloroplastic n=1 Tax=Phtheirospermum japonicum TaxID=374723 RepID=A0A830BF36_9LAMI|nr:pentatricopeptide repeat-containing protein at3g09650 chloroplastic [Phtheirospermum japonicum]